VRRRQRFLPCQRRALLEPPNHSSDLASPFEADVGQPHEFAARHPAQIPKSAAASAEQGPQHIRLEADVVPGQVVGIIEPDIHPGGPIRVAGPHEFTVFFPAGEKSYLLRLNYSRQDRIFQRGFRAKDLVDRSRSQQAHGRAHDPLRESGLQSNHTHHRGSMFARVHQG
jgi:hypothetical protein